jgi:hypothetical protein
LLQSGKKRKASEQTDRIVLKVFLFFSSSNKINMMVVKLGKKKSNESKRVKLRMSFLDELKNIMVVEAKASPSKS